MEAKNRDGLESKCLWRAVNRDVRGGNRDGSAYRPLRSAAPACSHWPRGLGVIALRLAARKPRWKPRSNRDGNRDQRAELCSGVGRPSNLNVVGLWRGLSRRASWRRIVSVETDNEVNKPYCGGKYGCCGCRWSKLCGT